ncbi:hypothetical protein C4Z92_15360 [Clostridioides difficile]|uniref:hypothetical protein n=1 Tax=Clostridioides difficile TaxID=1496 RepID=UPI0003B29B1D|nr:hypothetical protein [Clostridioides difficile]EGT3705295.1 hypothetical protein [Clostridioides difficile]EGT3942916.1 hypothetical protein [Clostridioides difficile]EGT3945894.1 hypothetical protein [Clostridioides difficile]EGT4098677.1 hypothetical protein [Clostridioides difficile]KJF62267.1 prophage protein [Clostridioides difficile]
MDKDIIKKVKFSEIDINDEFFKSLISDYINFEKWFLKKYNEEAYILKTNRGLQGFLYLKDEYDEDYSISPNFDKKRRLKIGTFKINSHGTVLGQRFISIILRKMVEEDFKEAYVTLFEKQDGLIKLFERFGFSYWGKKDNGELVYVRDDADKYDIYENFPRIKTTNVRSYLLGIYPKYHTELFPDSRLCTEKNHIIKDVSFTNTVEKVYLCNMSGIMNLKRNDLLLIYRTKEGEKQGKFSSVATSICTVVETKHISSFSNYEDFMNYCGKGSIFSQDDLKYFWSKRKYPYLIKMIYNLPLNKRIIRKNLIEKIGLREKEYWGFFEIKQEQLRKILEMGEVNESFIID